MAAATRQSPLSAWSRRWARLATRCPTAEEEETPLKIKLNELSRKLSAMTLVICAFVFIGKQARSGGKATLDTFMIGASLAVAAIPEGLSAVMTILLSIGRAEFRPKVSHETKGLILSYYCL